MEDRYEPGNVERKWQKRWEEAGLFTAKDPTAADARPKYYCLSMFPYPSGAIHMGHLRNYCIGDVISRYKRMRGFNVLQPVGWDAFGLPAENAAIQRGVEPWEWTKSNIAQMAAQFKLMGLSYDWKREVTTCLPEYYRWEQLFFRRFYEKGLAYKKTGSVNWCEACQTVLANEQVQEGKCWRCDGPVAPRELSQWYFRTTAYAEELLKGHAELSAWPARVLEMQKNWIGKSEGATLTFKLAEGPGSVEIFTTRPDTLFGVTFLGLSPHHPLAESLCKGSDAKRKLADFKGRARRPEEVATTKDGFFTGSSCEHPITGELVPIWICDFVVMDYGTGAVMAVPAHDERDFEFATQFGLPIKLVVAGSEVDSGDRMAAAYTGPGVLVASGKFSGMPSGDAKRGITGELEQQGRGAAKVQYRLRDWGISRQRYWGAPIPIIYCGACGPVLVPEKDLPVVLPTQNVPFKGQGNPLDKMPSFYETPCPQCGKKGRRETDTFDTFVESSWYYARYVAPKETTVPFKSEAAKAWLPVDCYIGGIEHACMHLLYARFFHKALRDLGYLWGNEPFKKLLSQGMVIKDGAKMSKSKGNVVPLDIIAEKYGADTGRLFSLFAAPPEKDLEWNEKGVEGCHRFLSRVWRLFNQFAGALEGKLPTLSSEPSASSLSGALKAIRRKTHWMVSKMTEDVESDKFNTAISAAMELVNNLYGLLAQQAQGFEQPEAKWVLLEAMSRLVLVLVPFAPHMSEELWERLGGEGFVSVAAWPVADPALLERATFLLVVQVNGKVRDKLTLEKGLDQDQTRKLVLELPKVKPFLDGKEVREVFYVPERLMNIVVS